MDRRRLLAGVALGGLLLVSGWLYLHRLHDAPVYLSLDEAHFAVHAHAIATTGRNLNGDLLPLFINLADPAGDRPVLPWGNTWYQPFLFYLIAAALQALPLSEASIRLPTAVLGGVVSVALMFAVSLRLFGSWRIAIAAAAMLAMCPANLIISRQALDYSGPVVFILAWLWLLASYAREQKLGYAIGIGLVLGAGCYSYITSWIMMPLYLALSWLAFARIGGGIARPVAASAAAFGMPLLALVPWLWLHPEMIGNLFAAYSMPDPQYASAIQALRQGKDAAEVVRNTVGIYWSFFDPSFLFISGGASRKVSTGEAGVLLLPMAVLLPVGIYALSRQGRRSWITVTLIAGLFTAPMAATLKGTPFAIERTMALLPFAVLISTAGLAWLWASTAKAVRVLAVALVIVQPLQFTGFYRDYLSGYRLRSTASYDPTAFAEAAPFLAQSLGSGGVPVLYLTAPLYDISAKWRFFATKLRRPDLLTATRYFDGNVSLLSNVPAGALVVVPPGDQVNAWVATGEWSVARHVSSADGRPALTILRRP
jgi:4-amino-4-deoxy-L-arabinose transferase-like glycosyltransferase